MRLSAAVTTALLVTAAGLLLPANASAGDAPPSAERLRSAASEYDAGRRAFGEKDYEGAATHFENAFHDAASAAAVRSAIRARRKAGQLARAATLATIAAARYPKDTTTVAVAQEVLREAAKKLHQVTLNCTPDCGVATDGRAISSEDGPQAVFFLEPGSHDVVVSWSSERNKTQTVAAVAGGNDTFSFEAPPVAPPPAAVVVVAPPPATPPSTSTKPLSPIFFYAGAGLTVVALGVTVWSGVDAENNPGAAAVKRDCVGQGTSCSEYQQGLSAQLRTNVLIGVSAGLGAATAAVGIFFTNWSGKQAEKPPPPVQAGFSPLPGGGAVALSGRF
jgi:hypothetical protein